MSIVTILVVIGSLVVTLYSLDFFINYVPLLVRVKKAPDPSILQAFRSEDF